VPAYVLEAEIELEEGTDPRAVGAAVTVELCGHWEHEGPCAWPHNSAIDAARAPALFRTIYVADEDEEPEIRERIVRSLNQADNWSVEGIRARPPAEDERDLANRLANAPRRPR
jgi:hypothetical protein